MYSSINEDEDDQEQAALTSDSPECLRLQRHLRLSFFLFGLTNNVLYVIILSAALDLVPPNTPKGIIAFCNIFPALVAKLGWPYVLKGRIRYGRRVVGCAGVSVCGMLVVALGSTLPTRLIGISLASFSSGLGELTFLQLSTTYAPTSLILSGTSVGYFASGTGAAGLVGALMWWFLRVLGVKEGVGVSSVLPLILPITYFLLLPRPSEFSAFTFPSEISHDNSLSAAQGTEYAAIPTAEDPSEINTSLNPILEGRIAKRASPDEEVGLTLKEKWVLVRPLLLRFMFPLFCVYTFEYTINQGIAPTLVFPPPVGTPILGGIIKSIRDYYPLWQLIYQSSVLISRSSLTLHIPPLPISLLPLPALIQSVILLVLMAESAWGIFDYDNGGNGGWGSILLVALLVGVEGICGGLAYVNTFYHISLLPSLSTQEREFKIGSIGFSDSLGILLASMISVPTEVWLCSVQVRRGRGFCREL